MLNLKKINVLGFLIPVIVLTFWYIVTREGMVPPYLVPSPSSLLLVSIDFAIGNLNITPYSGTLFTHAYASITRVLSGFAIATVLGLTLGFLTGRSMLAKDTFDPTVHLIRIIPGIGWLPIAIVWFGVGETTTLFLISLAAFFPIYVNAAQGASSVSPLLIRAGKMLGANNISLYTTVIIPAAMPSTIAGLRLGLGVSWGFLVLGELTGVASGLGALMMDARMLGHVDIILVSMICIGILGRVSDILLMSFFKRSGLLVEGDKNEGN
ncbi:binding-protein-dependent transport systems inner membrane component [Methanosalsum zhilinae DSM 4017]|uniref:Binding-protein-dependent transport systems inner membrane component n=1 Tax=Methanosalsum zhilinae (strain DSM 4017 / NBRC 107636 / OCM 62 / WeN5) TaxID=679901 RepID=F7XMY8_METZD|nr:ABC transporter permease [Methanosalsum zhilinae]AEH61097.1 binding-protein-dependent transport systems inner membrane component [Methanosalsum zhilinae DSM 4017]